MLISIEHDFFISLLFGSRDFCALDPSGEAIVRSYPEAFPPDKFILVVNEHKIPVLWRAAAYRKSTEHLIVLKYNQQQARESDWKTAKILGILEKQGWDKNNLKNFSGMFYKAIKDNNQATFDMLLEAMDYVGEPINLSTLTP